MRSALNRVAAMRGVRLAASHAIRMTRSTPTRLNPATSSSPALTQHAVAQRFFSTGGAAGPALVLVDHDNATLFDSTAHVVSAARAVGASSVVALVLGSAASESVAAAAAKVSGVDKVILVQDAAFEHALAEGQSTTIADIAKEINASYVLSSTSASGKNILPRLGAHLDVQPITEVIEIKSADTFVRPIYAGNAISTVQSTDAVKVLTVRPTSFERAGAAANSAPVEKKTSASAAAAASLSSWVSEELTRSARPNLSSAKLIVAGGRGLKSKENFAIIEELADALGGAVGASRAAVDAGYVPNDYQIGQTGKVVAPDLYIAVGISGAIQHLAGMKDSKVIVAINKDKEAPIFQVADYGLEGDLFKVVPDMTKLVKASK